MHPRWHSFTLLLHLALYNSMAIITQTAEATTWPSHTTQVGYEIVGSPTLTDLQVSIGLFCNNT